MAVNEVISNNDFSFVKDLIYQRAGIVIGDHKREMIQRRLSRRVRDLSLGSIDEYCQILRDMPDQEMVNFINAVTTNLTSFFRENHHFKYLSESFLPEFIESGNKHLRIWSSACSTGEEPYSLAITLEKSLGNKINQIDAKILATDLDTQVLTTARDGMYDSNRFKEMDAAIKSKWFDYCNERKKYIAKNEIKRHITFNKLNLLEKWPMKGTFDVIFCRNVLIYFDKKTQEGIVDNFLNVLKPNGLLMLGHSESILKHSKDFKSLGKTIFKKEV